MTNVLYKTAHVELHAELTYDADIVLEARIQLGDKEYVLRSEQKDDRIGLDEYHDLIEAALVDNISVSLTGVERKP